MIEVQVAIAMARLPAQRLALVFEPADQAPSGERILARPPARGRGGFLGGVCHATYETPESALAQVLVLLGLCQATKNSGQHWQGRRPLH